ncbi:MAG: hypothetical protein BGO49_26680 [Planctomycetales bacterium 71-10]|nr:MAG: hypothetical protein BGO49_26680 [Planctomycetales bacterium 71-10]
MTGRRLEARLDAIRKAGDPVSLADLAAKPIPPDTNADVVLGGVAAEVEAVQKGLMAIFPPTGRPDGPLNADAQAKVEALFRDHPRAIPRLMEAADRPDYEHAHDVSLPPTVFSSKGIELIQEHRTANRVLAAWSMLQTAQGKRDEAIATSIASLKLSAFWAREPLLTGYLVSVATTRQAMIEAERTLQAGPISDESRRRLDAELMRHDDLERYRHALRTERAFGLSAAREFSAPVFWMRGWLLNDLMLMLLDYHDEEFQRSATPFPQLAALGPPQSLRAYRHPWKLLVQLLEPAVLAARKAAETQRAAVRVLRILNALRALPADAPAPADLTTLGLPAEATIDPFTGKPLIVKKRPDGWLVYSVGPDLVDDGGTFHEAKDIGFEPVAKEAAPSQVDRPGPPPAAAR